MQSARWWKREASKISRTLFLDRQASLYSAIVQLNEEISLRRAREESERAAQRAAEKKKKLEAMRVAKAESPFASDPTLAKLAVALRTKILELFARQPSIQVAYRTGRLTLVQVSRLAAPTPASTPQSAEPKPKSVKVPSPEVSHGQGVSQQPAGYTPFRCYVCQARTTRYLDGVDAGRRVRIYVCEEHG